MKYPLLAQIKLYQWTISPLLGPVCKYYPSCSHYGYTAIDRHGAVKGTALTAWRILGAIRGRWAAWTMFRRASARGGTKCCVPPGGHARAGPPPPNRPPKEGLLIRARPDPSGPAAETSPHAQGA
ncbi:membrane protein insertion efficiency factor YidD [Streptomyces violaceorubidus]